MTKFNVASQLYRSYVLQDMKDGRFDHDAEVASAKADLVADMMGSADFHHDAMRNGVVQGMLFTRGGEQHTYNIVCMPDDQLYAGDMIDAFGEKWIVTEARADATTHKTGIMHQCNKLFKFQNPGDPTIHERWGYIDVSGYSSSFGNNTKVQKGEEQSGIYLTLDEVTERIFVDKRLAHYKGYDARGEQILSVFKVTGIHPHSESFNAGDHLLFLKVVRDLYSPATDNLELEICDYNADFPAPPSEPEVATGYVVSGRKNIRLGTSCKYRLESEDGSTIESAWIIDADARIQYEVLDGVLCVTVPDDEDLIGSAIRVVAQDIYEMEVEVVNGG